MKSIDVFFHICLIEEFQDINIEILNAIKKYGLLDEINSLNLGIVGSAKKIEIPYQSDKIIIHRLSDDISSHEPMTVELMQKFCRDNPDSYILKIHNAGLKQKALGYIDKKMPYWRYLEVYWLIIQYKKCLEKLHDGYDTVGIEVQTSPVWHYSGSWYWSKAKFINTLPCINSLKNKVYEGIGGFGGGNSHCCEFILSENENRKSYSLWDSGYHWCQRELSVEKVVKPFLDNLPTEEQYWL